MNNHSVRRQELFVYFENCVKRHFDFLDGMFQSIDKKTMGWIIRYVSSKVEVYIYYERISYEINLALSLKELNITLYIEEIVNGIDKRKFLSATSEPAVENAVTELKTLITKHGRQFISGDIKAFRSIVEVRERNAKDHELVLIDEKAVKAWENGNYNEVVALYQSIRDELTSIQEKRLSLSLKKIEE